MSDKWCTYCGRYGHRAHACPRRPLGRLEKVIYGVAWFVCFAGMGVMLAWRM